MNISSLIAIIRPLASTVGRAMGYDLPTPPANLLTRSARKAGANSLHLVEGCPL
jgi:hypothetical protein